MDIISVGEVTYQAANQEPVAVASEVKEALRYGDARETAPSIIFF